MREWGSIDKSSCYRGETWATQNKVSWLQSSSGEKGFEPRDLAAEFGHTHSDILIAVGVTHPQPLHSLLYIHSQVKSCSTSIPPTQLHSEKHFHSHTYMHTQHRDTKCVPLQVKKKGAGFHAQKPQVQVQPNVKQTQSWVMSCRRPEGLPSWYRHPFPWEVQELSVLSFPRTEGHQ